MVEIILLGMFILHLVAYNNVKNYLEEKNKKEKEKENVLRKGLI